MRLYFKHHKDSHNVFVNHPYQSNFCGIIQKLDDLWSFQIRYRNDLNIALLRSGYEKDREKALRKVIDWIRDQNDQLHNP